MLSHESHVFIGDRMIPVGPLKLEDLPPITGALHHLDCDGVPKEGEKIAGDLLLMQYPQLLTFFIVKEAGQVEYLTSVNNHIDLEGSYNEIA